MDKHIHCTDCIYKNLCTPFEKLLYTKNNIKNDNITEEDEEKCVYFIGINEFDNINNNTNGNIECTWQEMDGETVWGEMSWNKYVDNLFNYLEDN